MLSVALLLLLAVEAADRNIGDMAALEWHLTHGFRAGCCGLEISVPLKYSVSEDRRSVALFDAPGFFRGRLFHLPHSMIIIQSSSGRYDQETTRQARERLLDLYGRQGYRLMSTPAIEVAGKTLECSELYAERDLNFGPYYQVWCWGDGPAVSFEGQPTLLAEFYSIVRAARPVTQ